MPTERVGLVIGADASQFRREMKGASAEIEKLDRVLNRGSRDGIFSKQDAKDYDNQLGKTRQSIGRLAQAYQYTSREVAKLELEQQKLLATGGKVTKQQHQALSLLKTKARAQAQILASMQGQMKKAEESRQTTNKSGILGSAAGLAMSAGKLLGPLALAGMAWKAGSWIKGQADQGYSTAIANQMSRMQSARLLGLDPRNPRWRYDRSVAERQGHFYGYSTAETHGMLQAGARAHGRGFNPWMAGQNLSMMRGFNLDAGSLFGYQTAARQAGTTGDVNQALIRALKLGGFARALSGEMAQATTGLFSALVDSRERMGTGTVPGLIGALSHGLGGAFKASPQRTARLVTGLHRTISGPGGGDAGKAFMLRAMGFGQKGGPSYIKALEMMERGASDPENIAKMLRQVKSEFQGEGNQAFAMSKLSGGQIKIWQARRLLGLKEGNLTPAAIRAQMAAQNADIMREGEKSRIGTGFTRRQIALNEQRANIRVKLDSTYVKFYQAQIYLLKKIASAIGGLGKKEQKAAEQAVAKAGSGFSWWNLLLVNPVKVPSPKKGRNK